MFCCWLDRTSCARSRATFGFLFRRPLSRAGTVRKQPRSAVGARVSEWKHRNNLRDAKSLIKQVSANTLFPIIHSGPFVTPFRRGQTISPLFVYPPTKVLLPALKFHIKARHPSIRHGLSSPIVPFFILLFDAPTRNRLWKYGGSSEKSLPRQTSSPGMNVLRLRLRNRDRFLRIRTFLPYTENVHSDSHHRITARVIFTNYTPLKTGNQIAVQRRGTSDSSGSKNFELFN